MRNGTKKLIGAVLSALVMGGLMLTVVVCMLGDYFGSGGWGWEAAIILLCAFGGLAVVAGIALALFQRLRELKGGEEDEARKY